MKAYIDQGTKCSCGHEMAAHERWQAPCRCRRCDCEGFMKIHRDGTLTIVPVTKNEGDQK